MKKTLFILSCITLIFCNSIDAQSWQWGKVGKNLTDNYDADRSDLVTDANGNIYTLTLASNIDIDGHFRPGYGGNSLCIVSFDCEGNYRWGKIMNAGITNGVGEIKTDDRGGVYVSCFAYPKTITYIDSDATIAATEKAFLYLKYDTAGNYQWHFMPEPDSLSADGYDFIPNSMCIAANGEMRILASVKNGLFCDNNYKVESDSIFSTHILSYDSKGHFIKGTLLDIDVASNILHLKMIWNDVEDKFYICTPYYKSAHMKFGSMLLKDEQIPFGKFNSLGKLEWLRYGSSKNITLSNLVCDKSGSVYLACLAEPGAELDGYIFTNTMGTRKTYSILKYDKLGVQKWVINSASNVTVENFKMGLSGNTIGALCGLSNSVVSWGSGFEAGRSFNSTGLPFGDSFNTGAFFVDIDATTGSVIKVDSMTGLRIAYNCITGDKKGGFISTGISGTRRETDRYIFALPYVDTFKNIGFGTFMVKYGTNDCSPLSVPNTVLANDATIYPNPVSNFVVVENAALNSKAVIYTVMGQQIRTSIISEQKHQIDTHDLPSGIYILAVRNPENTIRFFRIVKL